MLEVEGKINDLSISILIDYGAFYNYVNNNLVEIYNLESSKLPKYKMVQLATRMKRKITFMVTNGCLEMIGCHTKVDLNIIPLGFYNVLTRMDCVIAKIALLCL